MIQTIVCIISKLPLGPTDVIPHPDITCAFIYNSNPHQDAQPAHSLPTGNTIVVNLGRQIATRGDILVKFWPHKQVLADRISVHTKSGSDIKGVDLINGETITIGWSCHCLLYTSPSPRD